MHSTLHGPLKEQNDPNDVPVGTQRNNNFIMTSKLKNDVALTL